MSAPVDVLAVLENAQKRITFHSAGADPAARELREALDAVGEMIDALRPFAFAWNQATQYGIVMTGADLAAMAARHIAHNHFAKATAALARIGAAP